MIYGANTFYFAAVIGNVKYSPTFLLLENELEDVELLNGGEISGVVAFEVPSGDLEEKGYHLVYESFLLEYNVVFQGH